MTSDERKQWLKEQLADKSECQLFNFGENKGFDIHSDVVDLLAENEALGELLSPLVDVELERDKLKAENEAWFELCRVFVGGGDKHILKMRDTYLLTREKPETPLSDVPITP